MSPASTSTRWRICTPHAPGAIAIIQLEADGASALDEALLFACGRAFPPGSLGVASIFGVDHGVAARWSAECAQLMPHGGVEVVREIAERLTRAGFRRADEPDARRTFPEARDEVEARALAALARAHSPLAIDLLLDQPRRWRGVDPARARDANDAGRDIELHRLIEPALVVIVGPPNIGKSTLLNALAGRGVSNVADEPGTTRDHVGVRIDLAGVVANVVDAPGFRDSDDEIERRAIELVRAVVARADLVILAGDPSTPPLDAGSLALVRPTPALLRVCLRADLGVPDWACDARVSVSRAEGLAKLVELVRDGLVPPEALADPRPWRFW